MPGPVVILGLGFTGERVARRLLKRNIPVWAAARNPARFEILAGQGLRLSAFSAGDLPKNAAIVHSIPPIPPGESDALHALICSIKPRRIVYISSTGVYGNQTEVSESTSAAPTDETGRSRVNEERWLASGNWSALALRAAAIYGPGRGVHVRLPEGKRPRGTGIVSRIHVEDLAALIDAGLWSDLTGAWPVADDYPCPTDEIVAWCSEFLGIEAPKSSEPAFPVSGRKVDGRAVRKRLCVELNYTSYKTGIPASLTQPFRQLPAQPE